MTTREKTRNRRSANMADIAREAGVSISTVSRALNNSDKINDETKIRIRSLANAHNYFKKSDTASAHGAPSRVISLVLPPPVGQESKISEPFYLDLIGGIGDALRQSGYDFLISHSAPTDYASLLTLVESGASEGIIFLGQSALHAQYNRLAETGAPFVVWGAKLPDQKYCSIGSDNRTGGRRATRHLLRLGRKNIAFLGDIDAPEVALRYQGYRDALAQAGQEVPATLLYKADLRLETALEAVDIMIDRQTPFDAIFAASDMAAIGAIRSLTSNGISVPGDVSVVGYDDVRIAAYSNPSLTTVRQDVGVVGRLLVSKMMRLINGELVRSEELPADLIVRESCGA